MPRTFIHLGRYGDIINTLPLLKHVADQDDEPVELVVSKQYADVLDGVSYVMPIIEDIHFSRLPEVIAKYPDAINLQVYGKGYRQAKMASSFCEDQWHNSGLGLKWGSLPLVFDKRNAYREIWLKDKYRDGRPMILVATHGFSSPFPHGEKLLADIREQFGKRFNVIDMSQVQGERIYDIIALYDEAVCLITSDTAHVHLAHASKVPVLAFAADSPSMWHGVPQRGSHKFYCRYGEFEAKRDEFFKVLKMICHGKDEVFPMENKPNIIHAYPVYSMDPSTGRRHEFAKSTWPEDEQWISFPMCLDSRSATHIGHHIALPFMRDMIHHATRFVLPTDIILISNSDVCFGVGMKQEVIDAIQRHGGAFFTHRYDFDGPLSKPIPNERITDGKWYPGSDVFGFTVAWWSEHGHEFPDMLMGAEFVDAVLRKLIKTHNGEKAELHGMVYHEAHENKWNYPGNKANAHNAALAKEFYEKYGGDDLDPFTEEQAEVIRQKRQWRRYTH